MDVADTLEKLMEAAKSDPDLKAKILRTRKSRTPLADFCRISTELGLPLYEMDVLEYGEASYAAMRRSTNGGGENSPLLMYEVDAYEMFLAALETQN